MVDSLHLGKKHSIFSSQNVHLGKTQPQHDPHEENPMFPRSFLFFFSLLQKDIEK